MGLILGIMVPTVKELGVKKGTKKTSRHNLCVSVWISLTLYHKVPYHKGKAWIEFGGNGMYRNTFFDKDCWRLNKSMKNCKPQKSFESDFVTGYKLFEGYIVYYEV